MACGRARRVPGPGPVQFEIGQSFQEEVRIGTAEERQSKELAGVKRDREDGWIVCWNCGGAGERPPQFEMCGTCGGLGEIPPEANHPETDGRE